MAPNRGPRYVDPTRGAGLFTRAYARATNNRLMRFVSRRVGWKLDPWLLRVTRGRLRTGLTVPMTVLETRGARSGARRRNAVIYFHDGDRITIVASHAGAPTNPAWYYNLRANPDVVIGGLPAYANEVTDQAERARLWALADRVFPPFAEYRQRADREIPLIQLEVR